MAPATNPTSLKGRGGRLGAFSRGMSDGDAQYNAPAPKHQVPEKRPDTPNATSSAPTREQLVENARIPVPPSKTLRHAAAHQRLLAASNQPLPPSPQKTASRPSKKTAYQSFVKPPLELPPSSPSRSNSEEEPRRHLFQGSELGEDFMKSGFTSGLTTPHHEIERYAEPFTGKQLEQYHLSDKEQDPMFQKCYHLADKGQGDITQEQRRPTIKDHGVIFQELYYPAEKEQSISQQERRHREDNDQDLMQNQFYRGPQTRRDPVFQVNENGFMAVKTALDKREPSYMNDGFQSGVISGHKHHSHDRQPSPVEQPAKLPIREVKVKRSRGTAKEDGRVKEKDTSRRFITSEEDAQYFNDKDEHQITPKAKKTKKARMPPPSPAALQESSMVSATKSQALQTKKRTRASPDYDDGVLMSKTFVELQQEPFDLDPAKTVILNGLGASVDNLSMRLAQVQQQSEKEQRSFFTDMPIAKWEESGDWFVDQFAGLMNKLKEARKNKRKMIQDFEAEAAAREEAVRLRSDAIDRKLVKMKQNGQRVVGGQNL